MSTSTEQQRLALRRARADWHTLGLHDPLWAVLVNPEGRDNKWDVEEFFASGRREVDAALERAGLLGANPGRGRALDFGCGVGRLSAALARHVEHVTGVDISASMLGTARKLDTTGRCEFVENDSPDLRRFSDAAFDIVYTSLVLQHLPPLLSRGYLAEMLRVLRPDGVLIVQIATRPRVSGRGVVAAIAPRRALRFAQRRLLRYPAPMDMYPLSRSDIEPLVSTAGYRILAADPVEMYGGHWNYARYVIAR